MPVKVEQINEYVFSDTVDVGKLAAMFSGLCTTCTSAVSAGYEKTAGFGYLVHHYASLLYLL